MITYAHVLLYIGIYVFIQTENIIIYKVQHDSRTLRTAYRGRAHVVSIGRVHFRDFFFIFHLKHRHFYIIL